MLRERVSDDVHIFTSELYAQVTAGLIVSPDGAAVIDTMAFPSETLEILDLAQNKLNVPVKYVINTHYHADHTYGTCLFKGAEVVAHRKCHDLLNTVGRRGLKEAKADNPALDKIEVILPDLVFSRGQIELHLGKKTLALTHSPGHSPDSITVLVKEDRILFAGDTMMPLPYFVDGSMDDIYRSLQAIPPMGLENIVQGHGEVILRGEIDEAVRSNLRYLDNIRRKMERLIEKGKSREDALEIDIESCGKSRIPLSGLVARLHQRNMLALYDQYSKKKAR
ncbi:MAG: MBL fold metallo-hydrolase [Chloroflexi bacterium]|nr:MBL fold metallo-hydrolase [Chloroflexota bacterium]